MRTISRNPATGLAYRASIDRGCASGAATDRQRPLAFGTGRHPWPSVAQSHPPPGARERERTGWLMPGIRTGPPGSRLRPKLGRIVRCSGSRRYLSAFDERVGQGMDAGEPPRELWVEVVTSSEGGGVGVADLGLA
jgi:hypothetical protein